jgi:glucose/mannose-6-phosphate isomerase
MADLGRQPGGQAWDLPAGVRAETAVGALAVMALGGLARLGLATEQEAATAGAAAALRTQRESLRAESPVVRNPAKRMAGQLMDRLPLIFGAGAMAAAARYWKCQINLLAKAPAAWDEVPEMDQNAVAGTAFPELLVSKHLVLALRSSHVPERLRWLVDETRAVYMRAGFNTDAVEGSGDSALAHALTAMQYGDYTAYYLAVCYGVDPGA